MSQEHWSYILSKNITQETKVEHNRSKTNKQREWKESITCWQVSRSPILEGWYRSDSCGRGHLKKKKSSELDSYERYNHINLSFMYGN